MKLNTEESGAASPANRVLLKPARAAQLLDCSRTTIYDLISRGAIRAVRVGGLLRIPHSEIERLANENPERGK